MDATAIISITVKGIAALVEAAISLLGKDKVSIDALMERTREEIQRLSVSASRLDADEQDRLDAAVPPNTDGDGGD
jgi:hypothetical protein